MNRVAILFSIAAMPVLMSGCQQRNRPAPAASGELSRGNSNPASPPAKRPTDAWLGKWIGPEGTYLELSPDRDEYLVKIQSLDGAAYYPGIGVGNQIRFERQGRSEFIRAGGGAETGMKWLLDKRNCLIIKTGEGFCRD